MTEAPGIPGASSIHDGCDVSRIESRAVAPAAVRLQCTRKVRVLGAGGRPVRLAREQPAAVPRT